MISQVHDFYIIWREWTPQQWIVSLDWWTFNSTRRFNEIVWFYDTPVYVSRDLVQITEEDITPRSMIIRKIRRKIWFPFETEDYNDSMDSEKSLIISFGGWNIGSQMHSLDSFISASWREITNEKNIRKRFEEKNNRILRIFSWKK